MRFLRTHFRRVFVPLAETTDGQPDLMALSGISPWLWRLYALFWLVCLWYALFLILQSHVTLLRLMIIVTSGLVCAALYLWFVWPHPIMGSVRWHARFPLQVLGFVTLAVLVILLSLFDHPAWLWLLVCVGAVAGLIFPPRTAGVILIPLTLCALLLGVIRLGWVQAIPLALLVRGLGLDMIGLVMLMGAVRQLHQQQRALAQLAVTEERLRVARDLHDLLGQSLSLITLKSALAGRLITADPTRAAQEIHEVEQAARATLREVRAAIAGYRQMSMQSEVAGARQLLEAVEIHLEIVLPDLALPSAIDTALAWVIREGVTNVLRHSHATQCQIVVQQADQTVWVQITNDGCQARTGTSGHGQGIAGLRERIVALGGQVEAGPTTSQGQAEFCLHAELPLEETSA
jgi:two-component system sensor histidine kinase DesK